MPRNWITARYQLQEHFNGLIVPAVWDFAYDGEAGGPFEVGEVLTFAGGGTATLVDLQDDGTTGTVSVEMLAGAAPIDDDTITGGTSGATAAVNGAPTGLAAETLRVYMLAPDGRQDASQMPYGYIIPTRVTLEYYPPRMRILEIPITLRVFLAPPAGLESVNQLHRRFDRWWLALLDQAETAIQLNDTAELAFPTEIAGLLEFDDFDHGWGIELEMRIRIEEQRPLTEP